MKHIVLVLVAAVIGLLVGQGMVFAGSTSGLGECADDEIRLNTDIPFVGRCIKKSVNPDSQAEGTTIANAFGLLLGGLMRILMTSVLVISFLFVLVGGFMYAMGGWDKSMADKGKKYIIKVIIGLILLGASGIILNLINPNFFGTSS